MYNPVGEGFALAEMLFQLSANLAGDEDKRYFLQMYFPSHFKFGMEEIAKSINARMEIDMDLDMDKALIGLRYSRKNSATWCSSSDPFLRATPWTDFKLKVPPSNFTENGFGMMCKSFIRKFLV